MQKKNGGKSAPKVKNKNETQAGGSRSGFAVFLLLLLLLLGGAAFACRYFWRDIETSSIKREFDDAVSILRKKPSVSIPAPVPEPPAPAQERPAPRPASAPAAPFPASLPDGVSMGVKLLSVAEKCHAAKKFEEARSNARIALKQFAFSDPRWQRCADLISKASFAILRSGADTALEMKRYLVREGDTLSSVALKFRTTPEAILAGNKLSGLDGRAAPPAPGQTLFIYCGKWAVRISNARKRLFIYDGDNIFAVYTIGVADDFKAVPGGYSIIAKIENPRWEYRGDIYSAGNPLNILGTRRIEFSDGIGGNIFLIHGTNKEENIGRTIKGPGCVSMKNAAVEEFFSLIPNGTPVEVIR